MSRKTSITAPHDPILGLSPGHSSWHGTTAFPAVKELKAKKLSGQESTLKIIG